MSSEAQFQSREEVKKARQLEEARKAGTAPAEKDEEGRDINPHIPQYISKAPWYLNQSAPGLKHQRAHEAPKESVDLWYERGLKKEKPEFFRKGACANCGASTHAAKDCVERPRKKGAKFTGKEMCSDEHVLPNLTLGFDGKRDRWAGYDPESFKFVVRDYEVTELERKKRRAMELHEKISKKRQKNKEGGKTEGSKTSDGAADGSESDSENESVASDDEDVRVRDFDRTSAPMGSKDANTRTTTRNLRIREDTAKYLYNLDLSSAFYDPKSRSMRANPLSHLKPEEQTFVGDNVMRFSGDSEKSRLLEVFAWEAYKHGANVHFNAQPTQLERMYQEHINKKHKFEEDKKQELLDKYGGSEYLNAPRELIYAQSEHYVEYLADGTPCHRKPRALIKSKYEEDVVYGGHTAVWGSWYDMQSGSWGFSCCHQLDRMADCITVAVSNILPTLHTETSSEAKSGAASSTSLPEAAKSVTVGVCTADDKKRNSGSLDED